MTLIAAATTAGCNFKWLYFSKSHRRLLFRQPSTVLESSVMELTGADGQYDNSSPSYIQMMFISVVQYPITDTARHTYFLLCSIHVNIMNTKYKNEHCNCDYFPHCFTTYATSQLTQNKYLTSYLREWDTVS
jgi:hypothetical protein